MHDLQKALTIIESADVRISNIEKFSALYFYLNSLKKKVEEIEKEVRKRGSVLMSDEDLKAISYENYDIIKIDPTDTEQYRAKNVIEGLGLERALPFLKIDNYLTTYLKKASATGVVTMEEITKCRKDMIKKPRMGYLKIQRKKNLT